MTLHILTATWPIQSCGLGDEALGSAWCVKPIKSGRETWGIAVAVGVSRSSQDGYAKGKRE